MKDGWFRVLGVSVNGTRFGDWKDWLGDLEVGQALRLSAEPDNEADPEAVRIDARLPGGQVGRLGYVPVALGVGKAMLFRMLQNGVRFEAKVTQTTPTVVADVYMQKGEEK